MQLFNKGNRTFETKIGTIAPGQVFEVAKKDAEILLALYGDELVEPTVAETAKKANQEVEILKADLKAVTDERDAAKKQVEDLQKELEAAQKEIEELQKDAEKDNK